MSPAVHCAAREADGRCALSSDFVVRSAPDVVWRYLCISPSFVGCIPCASVCSLTQPDANVTRVSLTLTVSRTLGVALPVDLEFTYRSSTHTMGICAIDSRVAFEASVRLSPVDRHPWTTVSYQGCHEKLTLAGLPVPFVDAKIRRLTEHAMHALETACANACWHEAFASTFCDVVERPLLDDTPRSAPTEVHAHISRLLRYNVQGGKAHRAFLVRLVTDTLGCDAERRPPAEQVNAAGWLMQIMQATALVADDIMDGSETRRGNPCWYREVGRECAINDSLLLYSLANRLMAIHFHGSTFEHIARLMSDVAVKTCIGQCLDLSSSQQRQHEVTHERYDSIVALKTAYYTFYGPMALAIILSSGVDECEKQPLLANAADVAVLLGQLFQEQDDYLDCFGGDATGKNGTDIAEGKCTWLYVHALANSSQVQRDELTRLYGTTADVERVKQIFVERGVHDEYDARQSAGMRRCVDAADARLQPAVSVILALLVHRTS